MDTVTDELKAGMNKAGEEIALKLVGMLQSAGLADVIHFSAITDDNIFWSFGRYIWHVKMYKRYCYDTKKIYNDYRYCSNLLRVTGAMNRPRMSEQLFSLTQATVNYLGIDDRRKKPLNMSLSEGET